MPVFFKRALVWPELKERALTVGEDISFSADKSEWVVEERLLLLPALFNMHTHGAMYGLKNSAEGYPLMEWLERHIWPAEAKLRKEDFWHFSLLSAVEMASSGIGWTADMYFDGAVEIAKAYDSVGMGGVVHHTVIGEAWEEQLEKGEGLPEGVGDVAIGIGAHAIYSTPLEGIREAHRASRERGVPFHIHVSETREEVFHSLKRFGKRPVEVLSSLGVLEGSLLAHASWVTKREIRLVRDAGAWPVHNPKSNQKLSTGGIAPVEEYGRFLLGTDGPASNNRLDLWEEMRMAAYLQRLRYWDGRRGRAELFLKAATQWGAKALGVRGGAIREGYAGRVVALSLDFCPCPSMEEALVFNAGREHVRWVVMKGRPVVAEGELEQRLRKTWQESHRYAVRRAQELWENGGAEA